MPRLEDGIGFKQSAFPERFFPDDVWEHVGLPKKECLALVASSPATRYHRHRLFSRIVPTVKDIGLWGAKTQAAYETLGILQSQRIDIRTLLEGDDLAAQKFDRARTSGLDAAGEAAV